MRTFTSVDELVAAVGQELGVSDWVTIDQERINLFAEATGDHQWIHVDPERAAAGPFGATIAHGYLTLTLIPWLGSQVYALNTPGAKLNYGINKVRFPAPVRVDSRIRARVTLDDVTSLASGDQVTMSFVIEIEGSDRPACVAQTVALLVRGG